MTLPARMSWRLSRSRTALFLHVDALQFDDLSLYGLRAMSSCPICSECCDEEVHPETFATEFTGHYWLTPWLRFVDCKCTRQFVRLITTSAEIMSNTLI